MLSTPAVGRSLWRCCYSPGIEFSVWSLLLPLSEGRQGTKSSGCGQASSSSQAAGVAGADVSAVPGASSAGGAKRRNQHCRTCGHKMRVGAFKRHHNQFLSSPGPIFTVPESRRRVKVNPIATRSIRMFGSECHCVGDDAYPGGCSSK